MRNTSVSMLLLYVSFSTAQAQWIMQDSHSTADLRGIHNVGNGVAWASGSNGTVLRTLDDGATWTSCAVPPDAEKLDFRGIQAFDADTAIVMSSGKGDLSRLYKTTDGCKSWKLVFTNPDADGFWDSIQFSNSKSGWILGDPTHGQFQLWETNTGGNSWSRERKNSALRGDAKVLGAFAASNSSLNLCPPKSIFPVFGSGGTSGAFFYSFDRVTVCVDCDEPPKNHWIKVKTPITSGSESAEFSLHR